MLRVDGVRSPLLEQMPSPRDAKRSFEAAISDFTTFASKRLRSSSSREVFTKPSEAVLNEGRDNVQHDFICRCGDRIVPPGSDTIYQIKRRLGQGAFGQVLKCHQIPKKEDVALKILRHQDTYKDTALQAKEEVAILTMLNRPSGGRTPSAHIVTLLNSFEYHGHFCMVFEVLGPDLYEFLQKYGKPGLPIAFVREITAQMLDALHFLQGVSVIHADLKPENVLLDVSCSLTRTPHAKIIDFGLAQTGTTASALFAQSQDVVIQTLPYRAPEVLLGLEFTCAADMWSLGCIFVEMFIGRPLFAHGTTEHEVVSAAVALLGPLPQDMLQAGRHTLRYFQKCKVVPKQQDEVQCLHSRRWSQTFLSLLRSMLCSKRSTAPSDNQIEFQLLQGQKAADEDLILERILSLEKVVQALRLEIVRSRCGAPRRLHTEEFARQCRERSQALDFLDGALQLRPENRVPACDALKQAFFRRV